MHQQVSSLQLPEHKIQELQMLGYNYCKDINIQSNSTSKIISISEWNNLTHVPKTKSALDCYQEECIGGNIITFNKELDKLLGGGIPIGLITEFCGEAGSGKTQICFQLSVSVQLPLGCGGMAGKALYISTNKGFASHRLKEIAEKCVSRYEFIRNKHFGTNKFKSSEFEVDSILRRIYHFSASEHIELVAIIKHLKTWLIKHSPIRLIIIDSISAPFKLLRGKEQTQIIYNILNDLQKLAEVHGFAIVITNDMTTRIEANNLVYQTPSLGGSYYHRINIRIQLHKNLDNVIKASVIKNVLGPPTDVELKLL